MPVNKKLTLLKTGHAFAIFKLHCIHLYFIYQFLYTCSTNHGSVDFPSASSGENQATPLFFVCFYGKHSLSDLLLTGMLHLSADGWIRIYPFLHDHRQ